MFWKKFFGRKASIIRHPIRCGRRHEKTPFYSFPLRKMVSRMPFRFVAKKDSFFAYSKQQTSYQPNLLIFLQPDCLVTPVEETADPKALLALQGHRNMQKEDMVVDQDVDHRDPRDNSEHNNYSPALEVSIHFRERRILLGKRMLNWVDRQLRRPSRELLGSLFQRWPFSSCRVA